VGAAGNTEAKQNSGADATKQSMNAIEADAILDPDVRSIYISPLLCHGCVRKSVSRRMIGRSRACMCSHGLNLCFFVVHHAYLHSD
jgi:hypothetical protein